MICLFICSFGQQTSSGRRASECLILERSEVIVVGFFCYYIFIEYYSVFIFVGNNDKEARGDVIVSLTIEESNAFKLIFFLINHQRLKQKNWKFEIMERTK